MREVARGRLAEGSCGDVLARRLRCLHDDDLGVRGIGLALAARQWSAHGEGVVMDGDERQRLLDRIAELERQITMERTRAHELIAEAFTKLVDTVRSAAIEAHRKVEK